MKRNTVSLEPPENPEEVNLLKFLVCWSMDTLMSSKEESDADVILELSITGFLLT